MNLAKLVETDFYRSIPILGWSCGFKSLTGYPCPLCGMTRSCLSTVSFRFEDAFHFHPLGPVVCLLILVMVGSYFLNFSTYLILLKFLRKNMLTILAVLWAVNLWWKV